MPAGTTIPNSRANDTESTRIRTQTETDLCLLGHVLLQEPNFLLAALRRGRYAEAPLPIPLTRTRLASGMSALGSATVKVLPIPFVLSTLIVAFKRGIKPEQMARPNPVPSWVLESPSDSWIKASNKSGKNFASIPIPVSLTCMAMLFSISWNSISTLPASVNLIALLTRLWNTRDNAWTSTFTNKL